jgi:hypothetical protein
MAAALAIFLVSLVLWLRLSALGDAKGIIDKAIKASGGPTKVKAQTWSEKGTNYETGTPQPYTAELALQLPDQFRLRTGDSIVFVNRDKGWLVGGNNCKEMTKEELASHKESVYWARVTSLLPLSDKEFTLTPLGESKLDDRAVLGVKVSSKGHHDVFLFFDKTTNLLAKSVQTIKVEHPGGEVGGRSPTPPTVVNYETFYSDYRAVQDVQVAMKVVIKRDGKLIVTSEKYNILLVDKLGDKEFKP